MARAKPPRVRVGVEQRRAEILDATRIVVLRRGFGGTRVQDVAEHLGISSGLIHYHFSTKDELLAETLRHAAHIDMRRLEKSVASGAHALIRLDRAIRAYLPATDDESWALWIDAWGEALRNPVLRDISEELDGAWVRLLERIVRDGVDEQRFECPDPQGAAWRLAALMDGLGLQVVLHRSTMSRGKMLRHIRTAVTAELGLPPDALPPR